MKKTLRVKENEEKNCFVSLPRYFIDKKEKFEKTKKIVKIEWKTETNKKTSYLG
jgi:hypothetical protein